MVKRRVVITGLGVISPVGNTLEDYWESLLAGKSGVDTVSTFDASAYSTQIAALVKGFEAEKYVDKKEARRTSRFILYGIAASKDALQDSGFEITDQNATRVGVDVGSGIGGIEILEEMATVLKERGPSKISPFTVPMMIPDMASGMISIKTGAKGPNCCSVTACASSANSMANAYTLIQQGQADVMITGGAEAACTTLGLASFCAARSLSERNDEPTKASRPFDGARDGFVMGEGAGILIFEELEHAKARGAKIYAEVGGYGMSGDAYHITSPAPEGEGAARAMTIALESAEMDYTAVDYINAHGTSTVLNDKNETMAMKSVFKDHARKLKISSTKSMTGHLLGAAGAIELIVCALCIRDQKIPPTINQETPDEICDLDYTPNVAINHKVDVAMSNSFGFGGHNVSLIVKKYS